MLLNYLQETLSNLVKFFVQIVLKNLFLHLNLMQLFLHAPQNLGVALQVLNCFVIC
jgi:hypothetical protein